ncbi:MULTISPECIES: YhcH/YjgK/YiaL family protein [unclassified Clostridium]|uniref:YhcH/YjgK/YiaL family protein n=1 Tax=unclassified Clostridium TaxID=2614128 RepID=UPI000297279F|nr:MULTISPECIES: YhcH/YjgK/YiaL family protein [unclassified Clostridium]EKQ56381.1 MAG: putative protein, YhcH/YjgK/YiaL family [Clostridium sp. Maddingley MBC34-26]
MIYDNIKNNRDYSSLNRSFIKAFDFLKNYDLKTLEPGEYNIDGDKIFANVQEYTTQWEDEKKLEAHEKYIDIQLIIEGQEIMGFAPVRDLEIQEDLRTEKDLMFFKEISDYSRIQFTSGDYAIFFPEDGHKPGCALNKCSKVKKVVVKVACK